MNNKIFIFGVLLIFLVGCSNSDMDSSYNQDHKTENTTKQKRTHLDSKSKQNNLKDFKGKWVSSEYNDCQGTEIEIKSLNDSSFDFIIDAYTLISEENPHMGFIEGKACVENKVAKFESDEGDLKVEFTLKNEKLHVKYIGDTSINAGVGVVFDNEFERNISKDINRKDKKEIASENDLTEMKLWQGSFHKETNCWVLEINNVTSKKFDFKFTSAYDDLIEGEAYFDSSTKDKFSKAMYNEKSIFNIVEDNVDDKKIFINVENSSKTNGKWDKFSLLGEDDLVINNIKLCMGYDEVAKQLSLKENIDFLTEGIDSKLDVPTSKSVFYDGIEIQFWVNTDNPYDSEVVGIAILDDKYKTNRDIKIGDSFEKVIEKYGDEYRNDGDSENITYDLGPMWLEFIIDKNKVTKIIVGSEWG